MTRNLFRKLQKRTRAVPTLWLYVQRLPVALEKDIWIESYTETEISMTDFQPESCAVTCGVKRDVPQLRMLIYCILVGWYCISNFPEHPFLEAVARIHSWTQHICHRKAPRMDRQPNMMIKRQLSYFYWHNHNYILLCHILLAPTGALTLMTVYY